jgi:hypothetical protein
MAPTYPECDESDLRTTMQALADLNPLPLFHEPINVRAENVRRIQQHADSVGVKLNTAVFASREAWQDYAVGSLFTVERLAAELGIADHLHLWPDKSLGNRGAVKRISASFKLQPESFRNWLECSWTRISEWSKQQAR